MQVQRFSLQLMPPILTGILLPIQLLVCPRMQLFNTTTRIFSWTPNTNQTGNYTVTFTVTDGQLSDSKNVLIKVHTANRAPVLEQIGNQTVNAGSTIQFAVNATDPDGDSLTYSATGSTRECDI